jgi:hypothetical protein
MSHVTTAPRKHAPVLVTENQLALSTAAPAPVGSGHRRWPATTLMGGLVRILAALTRPRPLHPHPHRELGYLEAARMSRAMDRL